MWCSARSERWWRRDGEDNSSSSDENSDPGNCSPWLVAVPGSDVLEQTPRAGQWRLGSALDAFAGVHYMARLCLLPDSGVMGGELPAGLWLVTARVSGKPLQPLPRREPWFQRIIGQSVDTEHAGPAAGIIAEDLNARMAEIH